MIELFILLWLAVIIYAPIYLVAKAVQRWTQRSSLERAAELGLLDDGHQNG